MKIVRYFSFSLFSFRRLEASIFADIVVGERSLNPKRFLKNEGFKLMLWTRNALDLFTCYVYEASFVSRFEISWS